MTIDHLNADELRKLLVLALDMLSPAKRRQLIAHARPAPEPVRALEFDPSEIQAAADAIAAYIEDHEEAVGAVWADDWNPDGAVQADLWALEEELEDALAAAGALLEVATADERTAAAVAEAFGAIRDLHATEVHGMSYGDATDAPAGLEALELWQFLYENRTVAAATLTDELVQRWPNGCAGPLLGWVLGDRLEPVLAELDTRDDAGAARWLIAQQPDRREELLARHAHLAIDLGQRYARLLADQERWPELERAAVDGIAVPGELLYRARMAQRRFQEAFVGAFPVPQGLSVEQLWDDALAAGVLDMLRQVARLSTDRVARWLGRDEQELLELPARYDHDAVKAVVSYAIARVSGGKDSSPASVYWLPAELLARLGVAPGPHHQKRCVEVALTGYEQMIAFHIAGRARNRYRRAAAYWQALRGLATTAGQLKREEVLLNRHLSDLRRLPALRDEMAAVGIRIG